MDHTPLTGSIGYSFGNQDLLRQALTHRSHSATHNERLEFLGDSILNLAVSLELYERFPYEAEGELTRLRASIVNQQSLHAVAVQLGMGAYLLLGEGECRSGGAQRPSILADSVEALIGAVFLDGGFDAARSCVRRLFSAPLVAADPRTLGKDPKTMLQEFLQAKRIPLPSYNVVATTGGAHAQTFRVECVIPQLDIRTEGEGSSRRSAEQIAARSAYELGTRA